MKEKPSLAEASYVPMTFVTLSIARSLICDASK